MTGARSATGRRRATALSAVLAGQAVAAVFFIGDVVLDLVAEGPTPHLWVEALVAGALVAGLGFGAVALRRTLAVLRAQGEALAVARGALAEVVARQFAAWRLTPAEADVGLLALKGLDIAEIAALRGAAAGTVRAQLARIYAKAGVSGRAQFAAFFVEDLLADGLSAPAGGVDRAQVPALPH